MRVNIVESLDLSGMENLGGLVVILDVIRASNTTIALLDAGAAGVLPVAELELAYGLKEEHPDWLLVGERGGQPPAGFDMDNSPARAKDLNPAGKTVIHTTAAGTQAAHRLTGADTVLYGSFANASALVAAIKRLNPPEVNLKPMGFRTVERALEDDLAAEYLQKSLAGSPPPFAPMKEKILAGTCAEMLRGFGQLEDLAWCTSLDIASTVPVVRYLERPTVRALPAKP